jgi:hypothetical protein
MCCFLFLCWSQLDGDEPVDDDYDSLAPSSGIDPFSVPSFAPVMRVVDPATSPYQQPAGMKQLTIQLAGAAAAGLAVESWQADAAQMHVYRDTRWGCIESLRVCSQL